MKHYIPILANTALFAGVSEAEIEAMLSCLGARQRAYTKGDYVLRCGDTLGELLILTEGTLHIQQDDYWGNRTILRRVAAGELFGEAYAAPESGAVLNDVVAVQDSTVLFLDVGRVLHTCSSACCFHAMVVRNLFAAMSEKNRALVQKLGHMSKRTTREKLRSYLSEQAAKAGSASFTIPFNRQQLADFLSVDRSAMSNELCKMRDEGLLRFKKNRFTLL